MALMTYNIDPETALSYLHEIEQLYDVTVDEERTLIDAKPGPPLIAVYDPDRQKLTIVAHCSSF